MTDDATSKSQSLQEIERARERAEKVGVPIQAIAYEYKTESSIYDEKWHSVKNWEDIDYIEQNLKSDDHGMYAVRNIEPMYTLDRIELAADQGWLDELLEESDGDE